jgi:Zn finger protein HypA/HybF involved in hydrogenase expression
MHEMSVAMEICRMAEERLQEQAPRLRVVGLDVGDDSGLESDNLQFCLDVLLSQPPFGLAHSSVRRLAGDSLRLDFLEVDDGSPDD